jgi:MFS transporter, SP family, general alpha glucoside:H+ symporter
MAALMCLSGFLFIVFFAPNKGVLLAGELLCGFPWGIFATTAPAYASEVLPLQLRVYFTSYTNMCFIIGQLISGGLMKGLVSRTDQWGYRIPFAVQWFWPLVLTPLIFMAPESPVSSPLYLVREGMIVSDGFRY